MTLYAPAFSGDDVHAKMLRARIGRAGDIIFVLIDITTLTSTRYVSKDGATPIMNPANFALITVEVRGDHRKLIEMNYLLTHGIIRVMSEKIRMTATPTKIGITKAISALLYRRFGTKN